MSYAAGKEAVIVFTDDVVSEAVINSLADLGVKYIATRSTSTIDQETAALRKKSRMFRQFLMGDTTDELSLALARETILNLDKWQRTVVWLCVFVQSL
ncbi:hypothetical protein CS542_10235 [Pedobacter sp. IW39]|nr:hypothetical protein CS542_10235 [Pedobacter sp. IW39]